MKLKDDFLQVIQKFHVLLPSNFKNTKIMTVVVAKKPKEKTIDWINPNLTYTVTMDDYRNEMMAAENSGFITLEEHKKNMNQWMTTKLQ
jgi:hypothetical protein